MKVVVEADGGARGNPGPAGYGAVVRDVDSGEVLLERMGTLGVTTNNVAEYSGLIAGLTAAADLGATEVEVRMDSKLVVEQMSGRWQIKHPGLRPLAAQAAALVGKFAGVTFTWVPRERNRRADALANAAMDGKSAVEEDLPGPVPGSVRGPVRGSERGPGRGPVRGSWEPPTASATRLILLRHGETGLTAQRRYSGRGDVPLTSHGTAQARSAARRIARLGVDVAAVVSSPLSRCVETAQAVVAAAAEGPVRVDPDLIECDFGAWEGLTFAEVRRRWPAELDAWLAGADVAPPGGEPFSAVASRVSGVVARLPSEYPGRGVVLVSHVTPIKLILRDALAASDALLHRLYLDPGGLSIVDMYADGAVAVRTVNDTSHLR